MHGNLPRRLTDAHLANCGARPSCTSQTCNRARAGMEPSGFRDRVCPEAALRAVPERLLLSCLQRRTSWLTVESDRRVDAAGVLHRRGGRAAVAVSVNVADGARKQRRWRVQRTRSRRLPVARSNSGRGRSPDGDLAEKAENTGGVSASLIPDPRRRSATGLIGRGTRTARSCA